MTDFEIKTAIAQWIEENDPTEGYPVKATDIGDTVALNCAQFTDRRGYDHVFQYVLEPKAYKVSLYIDEHPCLNPLWEKSYGNGNTYLNSVLKDITALADQAKADYNEWYDEFYVDLHDHLCESHENDFGVARYYLDIDGEEVYIFATGLHDLTEKVMDYLIENEKFVSDIDDCDEQMRDVTILSQYLQLHGAKLEVSTYENIYCYHVSGMTFTSWYDLIEYMNDRI